MALIAPPRWRRRHGAAPRNHRQPRPFPPLLSMRSPRALAVNLQLWQAVTSSAFDHYCPKVLAVCRIQAARPDCCAAHYAVGAIHPTSPAQDSCWIQCWACWPGSFQREGRAVGRRARGRRARCGGARHGHGAPPLLMGYCGATRLGMEAHFPIPNACLLLAKLGGSSRQCGLVACIDAHWAATLCKSHRGLMPGTNASCSPRRLRGNLPLHLSLCSGSSKTMSAAQALPPALLGEVFAHLPLRDRVAAAQTCTAWHAASAMPSAAWRELKVGGARRWLAACARVSFVQAPGLMCRPSYMHPRHTISAGQVRKPGAVDGADAVAAA